MLGFITDTKHPKSKSGTPKNQNIVKHDKMLDFVDNMLELQKKRHEARMDRDKELCERRIRIVDAQIDRLVYDLYGLTEEIKITEKA